MQRTIEVDGRRFRIDLDPGGPWLDVYLAEDPHRGMGFTMSAAASDARIEFRCRRFLTCLGDSGVADK